MKHTQSPEGVEKSSALHKLPAGSPVLVWREKLQSWEGPFPFISKDGETAFVQLPHGRNIFPSRVVRLTNGRKINNRDGVFFRKDEYNTKEKNKWKYS